MYGIREARAGHLVTDLLNLVGNYSSGYQCHDIIFNGISSLTLVPYLYAPPEREPWPWLK